MNDVRAADNGAEIELAREKPFRLAGTRVRPASLELEFQSETTSVEPRVMQVLVALNRAAGEPTSRRRLIGCCWGGRLVSDGALNRSIAQLRKALRDPGIEITTITRVGYRLRAAQPAEELAAQPAAEPLRAAPAPTHEATGAAAARSARSARSPQSGRAVQVAAVIALALLVLATAAWEWVT